MSQNIISDIRDINKRYNEWAEKMFPNSTPISSLIGLKREIDETIEEIDNFEVASYAHPNEQIDEISQKIKIEYADCLMYLIDSARRFGLSLDDLFLALDEKLQINIKRNWKINKDKSYSHIK